MNNVQNMVPMHSTNNAYVLHDNGVRGEKEHIYRKGKVRVFTLYFITKVYTRVNLLAKVGDACKNSDRFSECLVRLPIYAGLIDSELDYITSSIEAIQL